MPYKVSYLDIARQDIKEAKAWYKKQRNGLQKQFAEEVIKAILRMQSLPTAYAIRYKNIRIVHTKTFPFGIHFYIDEAGSNIIITAIIHDYRNIIDLKKRE